MVPRGFSFVEGMGSIAYGAKGHIVAGYASEICGDGDAALVVNFFPLLGS